MRMLNHIHEVGETELRVQTSPSNTYAVRLLE